ncbi:hypothetical protein [Streptomyces mirabilis]|uniref:hypothetical protein n=1 Tax=Streptomyces mirabilis TaxID=68239 RepID=UPI0036B6BF49
MLLEHRDGLVLGSWEANWLGERAENIDYAAEYARFTGRLESFARIHSHASERNQPSTTTDESRRTLALANEFTYQERPEMPRQLARSQTRWPRARWP